ncbi:unnamed protein product, partial [Ascophyllum nodosum]
SASNINRYPTVSCHSTYTTVKLLLRVGEIIIATSDSSIGSGRIFSSEMWRPTEVVPQYRHRAVLIWAVLIVSIVSYFGLVMYRAVSDRENPSTSFIVSNEIYIYPDLWVCLYDTYGCDKFEYEEQCLGSIFDTEGGSTRARYRPGDANETSINFTTNITDKRGWCVIFETSALEFNLGEERNSDDFIDYCAVDMYWYPGGSAQNSTTCIQEAGAWTAHKENIYVFLNDPLTDTVSAGIQVPYSCMTNESSSHFFTYVGIGVTKQHKLDGAESASYNALTLATVEHKDEVNTRNVNITGIQAPYAYMKMQLQQESDSLILVTEIDPLDIAEILGQVGGFWDLILIFWPFFFVAASREPPHLKPRNFRKSVVRVKEKVTNMLEKMSVAPTSRDPPRSSFHDEQQEEILPDWER